MNKTENPQAKQFVRGKDAGGRFYIGYAAIGGFPNGEEIGFIAPTKARLIRYWRENHDIPIDQARIQRVKIYQDALHTNLSSNG